MMTDLVSSADAVRATSEFAWRFFNRAGDDIYTLIGDTGEWKGRPIDPPAWQDWLDSLDWINAGNQPQTGADRTGGEWESETRMLAAPAALAGPRSDGLLSLSEAFWVMAEFVWFFTGKFVNKDTSVPGFLRTLREADDSPAHPFWRLWSACIVSVQSGAEQRPQFWAMRGKVGLDDVSRAIKLFEIGVFDAKALEDWAEDTHSFEGGEYDPADSDAIAQAILELSTPELFGEMPAIVESLRYRYPGLRP